MGFRGSVHQKWTKTQPVGVFVLVCWFLCVAAKNLSSNLLFVEPLSSDLWAPDDPTPQLCSILTQESTEALNVTKRGLFYTAEEHTELPPEHTELWNTLSVCQTLSQTWCPCTHLTHAGAAQPCQPLHLGSGSQGEGRASLFGMVVLAMYSNRGFYWFPDKAVQEEKVKSGSPSDSGDILRYIAETVFALVPISKH